MNINVHTQGFELTPMVDSFLHHQLKTVLKRFRRKILHIDVFLRDLNGPKGGYDTLARIRVRIVNGQMLDTSISRENHFASINMASQRMQAVVKRALDQHRQMDR